MKTNTLAILIFNDLSGDRHVVRNPSINVVNYIGELYPTAILKIYDFETGEIFTEVVDNFQWVPFAYECKPRLNEFYNYKPNNELVA